MNCLHCQYDTRCMFFEMVVRFVYMFVLVSPRSHLNDRLPGKTVRAQDVAAGGGEAEFFGEKTGVYIGPILDDRLKEKFLKPSKGVLCIHFRVCLSVCLCVCLCVCLHAGYRAHLLT